MNEELRLRDLPLSVTAGRYLKQRELEDSLCEKLAAESVADAYNVSNRFISFDLSRSYFFDLGVTVWLITLLHKLKKQGNELQIVFPEPIDSPGEKLWSFLLRWRFFEALAACVDDPLNLLPASQHVHLSRKTAYDHARGIDETGEETILHTAKLLEITPFGVISNRAASDEGLEAFSRRFGDREIVTALSRTCGWTSDEAIQFTSHVISEGVRNASFHGDGSFALVAMRLDKRLLTLAIADNGRGIPHSLRTALSAARATSSVKDRSDADLIRYFATEEYVVDSHLIRASVQKGVTSGKGHAGLGLYYLKSHVLEHNGELRIRSGKACVDFSAKNETVTDTWPESPGTLLRIAVPLKK